MIDHIGVDVSDFDSSKEFYKAALMPLGYELAMEFNGLAGFGDGGGEPDFWIHQRKGTTSKVHVAFRSANRTVVRPTGGETGRQNANLTIDLGNWNRQTNLGVVFDSSSSFKLPNGAEPRFREELR